MNIRNIAYSKYQLDWMLQHGHTLDELINSLDNYMRYSYEPLVESYSMWDNECGFGGEIWVCFDEFIDCEYQDKEYMRRLLDNKQYKAYQKDLEEESNND